MKFSSLVPFIKDRLIKHHELYSGQCKAEYWEENLCWALKQSGFGSDWTPDFNHGVGVDQTTDNGIRISNKGGKIKNGEIEISGSRLTKHKTLQDKLEFLSVKKEDYIFCLATDKDKKAWKCSKKKVYYFIVIDSAKLNYHDQQWSETFGQEEDTKNKVNGWSCVSENYSAKIVKSMSDQLWTRVKLDCCDEIHEIKVP